MSATGPVSSIRSKERMSTSSASMDQSTESRQNISRLDLFGICFNVVAVAPSVASVLMFSLPGGGTHGITWAWLVCSGFVTVISLAVVELMGSSPTSAGVYKSVYDHAPTKYRQSLSWAVGYVNVIGNVASVASICWAISSHIMSAAFIGSGFMATRAETFGVYCAVLLLQGATFVTVPVVKPGLPRFFMFGNTVLWLALVVALPAAAPKPLNTPKFVFGTFTNVNRAWDNNVFAFLLTFVGPFWALGRATTTIHMADVAKRPKQDVAYAVAGGTLLNALMALALNIAIAFSMGNDLHTVLNDSREDPISVILLHALGKKGALATFALLIVLQFNAGATMLSATTTHISSFSNDYSSHDKETRKPIATAGRILIAAALLGLLSLADTGAINSLFSTAVVGPLMAFTATLIISRFNGRAKKDREYGTSAIPLGFLFISGTDGTARGHAQHLPIAIIAVIIMTVLSAFFLFPQSQHPSGGDVNYTAPILAGLLIVPALYFSMGGRGRSGTMTASKVVQ